MLMKAAATACAAFVASIATAMLPASAKTTEEFYESTVVAVPKRFNPGGTSGDFVAFISDCGAKCMAGDPAMKLALVQLGEPRAVVSELGRASTIIAVMR